MKKKNEQWKWLVSYRFKSHAVPESLFENVKDSLEARGADIVDVQDINSIGIDLPGMMSLNRNEHKLQINGITISIPSTDLEYFFEKLKSTAERNEIGQPYYKMHGYMKCICLTPEHRDELLKQMAKVYPQAIAIADLENEEFNKKLAGIQKHANVLVAPRPVRKKKKTDFDEN